MKLKELEELKKLKLLLQAMLELLQAQARVFRTGRHLALLATAMCTIIQTQMIIDEKMVEEDRR